MGKRRERTLLGQARGRGCDIVFALSFSFCFSVFIEMGREMSGCKDMRVCIMPVRAHLV